jgi:phosphate starvation-inducible PhoH-like protein
LEVLRGVPGVGITEFTVADVVRHPLVARSVEAYEKRDGTLIRDAAAR